VDDKICFRDRTAVGGAAFAHDKILEMARPFHQKLSSNMVLISEMTHPAGTRDKKPALSRLLAASWNAT